MLKIGVSIVMAVHRVKLQFLYSLCTSPSKSSWFSNGAIGFGYFRKTRRGNHYILVISDYFTRWVEAYELPDQEASKVTKTLVEECICRFDAPDSIHSDQGRNF